MTDPQSWSKPFIIGVMVILVAVFYLTAAAHFSYTTDDSYIYFQYARSLAQGEGPCFNAGDPSYGFTSPLWLLILSAGGAVGSDIPLLAKALDLIFASLSIILFFFVVLELARDVAVAFCASLAFSVNAWLLRWAGSGLETSLAVLLILVFFRYLLRNEYAVASGVAGLLALVRPEASLLMGLLIWDLRINSLNGGHAMRMAFRVVPVWLAIVLPWAVYAYAQFGSVLPATFGAKRGGGFDPGDLAGAAGDIAKTLGSADGVVLAALFVSLAILIVRHRRSGGAPGDGPFLPFHQFRQGLVGVGWLILLPLAYTLFTVNIVSRYLLIVTPLAVAMAYFYLYEVLRERPQIVRYGLVLALTGFVMLQNQMVYSRYVAAHVGSFTEGMESCLIPMGRWLKENAPPGTVIMTGDVGALGYFSGRTICDFNGIVSPGIDPPQRDNDGFTKLLRDRGWDRYCVPDYVVHRSTISEELADVPGLVPVMTRPFPGLSISNSELVYFTLYRVDRTVPEKLLTLR